MSLPISFEFFPPKTPEGADKLRTVRQQLYALQPQFELQPGQVGKGGIVRDAALYPVVEERLRSCCAALGLQVLGWHDSAITGGDGNREFFIHARRAA